MTQKAELTFLSLVTENSFYTLIEQKVRQNMLLLTLRNICVNFRLDPVVTVSCGEEGRGLGGDIYRWLCTISDFSSSSGHGVSVIIDRLVEVSTPLTFSEV